MTKLIDSFIHKILLQIKSKKTSLIRLEGIDDIEIYYHICKYFSDLSELDNCIIKLTKEKYDEFCAKSSNHVALNFFLQGKNAVLDEPVTDSYRINSYVDYDNAITLLKSIQERMFFDNTIKYFMALAYDGLNNTTKAKEFFEAATEHQNYSINIYIKFIDIIIPRVF